MLSFQDAVNVAMANPEESSSPAVPPAPPVGPPPTLAESAAAAGLATLSSSFLCLHFHGTGR